MKFVEENRDMFEPFVEDDVPFEQYVGKHSALLLCSFLVGACDFVFMLL